MGNLSLLNVLLASSYSNSCFLNSKLRMLTPSSIPLRSSQTISFFAVKSPACTCSQQYKPYIPKQEKIRGCARGAGVPPVLSPACTCPQHHKPYATRLIRAGDMPGVSLPLLTRGGTKQAEHITHLKSVHDAPHAACCRQAM